MPLHIDKRPTTLDEFLGNSGIKDALRSVLTRTEDIPHSLLFTGPSGCGKTTLGRIAANMMGCHADSIMEYNSSNTRGIDTIREISQNAMFSPMTGKVKVYIIDECHKMTNDAQNALLKILEDTPKHVYFILCTTDPEKLIKAIKTRCMGFEVKSLPCPVITKLLKDTLASEGIDDFPDSVVNLIAKTSEGCPRQALILLDSVIDILDEETALRAISEATASETASIDLCRLLIDSRPGRWKDVQAILRGLPDDAEGIRYGILGYMQKIILNEKSNIDLVRRAALINDFFMESFMYSKMPGLVNACFYACEV